MARFEGVSAVIGKLKKRAADGSARDVKLSVGYYAPYAMAVHENRGATFKVGRAGFLLDVAREMKDRLAKVASAGLRAGVPMADRLQMIGDALLAESKRNCPVDTGYLRSTGYARVDQVK